MAAASGSRPTGAVLRSARRGVGALLRSMKTRVFLAAVAVALVPLATFVGWGLLLQKDQIENESAQIDARNGTVHAAWDQLGVNETARAMSSLSSMRDKLSPAEYRELLSRVVVLMESSDRAYAIARTTPAALIATHGLLGNYPGSLAKLRQQGYLWGDATAWYQDESARWTEAESSFGWMGEDTPFVAWMPERNRVWYVQVSPVYPSLPEGVPAKWIATVIVVMLIVIAGFAVLATLLATRGVAKPLKRMALASNRLTAAGDVEPVPVKGPSEVRRATEAFNAMAARLAEAQDTEQQFLLSVSHELKTPLTSIKGYGEALTEGAVAGDEAGPVVAEEAGRMQRLVQDLLDLGRTRKSTFGVRHEAVDLAQVGREAVRRHESRAEEYKVELVSAVPDYDAPGYRAIAAIADGDRLLQVVSNLVENAVRCAPAFSRVTVTVGEHVRSQTGRDEVFVRVADSGLGLQEDELEHAFDRFYLYERYGRERPVGTGLGLAIVKELTEAMGGHVEVAGRPGDGTVFTVSLPRSVGDAIGTAGKTA
jgi:signal transduction histidine kinase